VDQTVYVRDLIGRERLDASASKTGDRLSDGSVLLWCRDMDRMGLQQLREFIRDRVVGNDVLAVADEVRRLRLAAEEHPD
jgi:hypothetical protein